MNRFFVLIKTITVTKKIKFVKAEFRTYFSECKTLIEIY